MSERSIFLGALDIADPVERVSYLDHECGSDVRLRKHIDELIAAEPKLGGFLAHPHAASEMTADLAPMTEHPGTMIGPYKLREQIGEGGFGVVYVAEQEKPVRRKVALKIIKPGMDTKDVIARFEAERQALALMDHPNVARVLDAGATDSGRPYFVMELVHGVPITEFCDRNKLPTRDRLLLFADVCRAVQHAHQKGIIHRDLKPSNIMVTLHDGKPVAKVIDFGVSKALSQQLTEKSIYTAYGQMIGTPSYMSPEQAEMSGLGIDTRSDIYSLGVLLYELLTGKTPLDLKRLREGGYGEMMRMIREEEPPRPSLKISTLGEEATAIAQHRHTDPHQLRRSLRGELDWIVMKCLEKDRARRYETANSLARDVERFLQDEPVEACPPSATYRLRKFSGKHKVSIAVAIAFLGLLLIGVAVSTWQRNVALESAASEKRAKEAEATERERAEANAKVAADAEKSAIQEKNNALAAREELRETLYASEMNLIQAAAESHQYARAAQLLYQQRPALGQTDLRCFEWHYWQRRLQRGRLRSMEIPQLATATDRLLAAFERASSEVRVFNRNGTRLVAFVTDRGEQRPPAAFGLLTNLDCSTGRELFAPFDPFPDEQVVAGRRPLVKISENGTRLATTLTSQVGTFAAPAAYICIRDGGTGNEIRRIESPGIIKEMALTKDGSQLAAEYQVSEQLPTPRLSRLNQAERTKELRERASRQQSATKIWDTSTGEVIQTLPKLPASGRNNRILWSPDGTRLLRQSIAMEIIDDKQTYRELFQVIDVASGQKVWEREFPPHAIARRAWSWSPDGKLLAIFEVAEKGIAAKHNVQLWDSDSGATWAILDRENPSDLNYPGIIDFSPDGRLLAVASTANEIYVWEVPELSLTAGTDPLHIAAPRLTLQTAGEGIQALAFGGDGRELHSVDGTLMVTWDATAREDAGLGPDSVEGHFISAISEDGTKVALSTASLQPRMSCLWDLTKKQEVFRLKTGGASRPSFSADGRRVALVRTGEGAVEIVIYNTQTGEALSTITTGQTGMPAGGYLDSPVFRPDGGQIAALLSPFRSQSPRVQQPEPTRLIAWDAVTGQQAFSVPIDATVATGLAYSPDGSSLVLGTNSQGEMAAVFYDAAMGERQRTVPMPSTPRTELKILARHQIFANFVGSDALFLDLVTGQERFRLPGYHDLEDVAISPDGSRLAAGRPLSFGESEVSLWSLKTGRQLLALKRQGTMESISFSPDGYRLVATFYQPVSNAIKPIQIWDATPLPEEVAK